MLRILGAFGMERHRATPARVALPSLMAAPDLHASGSGSAIRRRRSRAGSFSRPGTVPAPSRGSAVRMAGRGAHSPPSSATPAPLGDAPAGWSADEARGTRFGGAMTASCVRSPANGRQPCLRRARPGHDARGLRVREQPPRRRRHAERSRFPTVRRISRNALAPGASAGRSRSRWTAGGRAPIDFESARLQAVREPGSRVGREAGAITGTAGGRKDRGEMGGAADRARRPGFRVASRLAVPRDGRLRGPVVRAVRHVQVAAGAVRPASGRPSVGLRAPGGCAWPRGVRRDSARPRRGARAPLLALPT